MDLREKLAVLAIVAAATDGMDFPGFGASKRWRNNRTPYVGRDVPRNKPCPCGSGKKYKRCCMRFFDEQK